MKKIRHWPQEELEYVRDCRERLKPVSYSDIAKALGRSIRECQSRYHYYFGDHKRNDEMLPANITICWLCKHTNRFACPWFDPDNPRPVDGWTAEKETKACVNTSSSIHHYVTYKVSDCPNFVPDDPTYYARWRKKHKTKNVGECRSTRQHNFPAVPGRKKYKSTVNLSNLIPPLPCTETERGLCEGGNYNGQYRHPIYPAPRWYRKELSP